MLLRAQILTPWIGSGTAADPYRPQLADDFTLKTCCDVTGQPCSSIKPSPNLYTVECILEDTVLADIEASPSYGSGAVLWSETL